MSRRFLLFTAVAFVICLGLILLTAYSVGADPLHPRSRHIWGMSLVAALYASVRLSMIVIRYLDAREFQEGISYWTGLPIFGRKEHAIDRRMAARKARVEAAQKRANETETTDKETGDE